jgi:hypothetical protein
MLYIFVLVVVISVVFLVYTRSVGLETISPHLRNFAVPAAKYVSATFIGTYGSLGMAVVVASPLLLYSHLAQTHSGTDLFSALLDRSYFPLQTAVALILGYVVSAWFKEGWPAYVWVWPVAQVSIAVSLFHPSVMQSFGSGVWQTFFDWGCRCSTTLVQWAVMSPLYPSLAFSAAACVRGTKRFSQRTNPAPAQ